MAEVVGTAGNDRIRGTRFDDVIYGLEGDDKLDGHHGDDQLFGGDGNDQLEGSKGNDLLDGGAGDDQLSGGDGDDFLIGGPGSDFIDGGSGIDTAFYSDSIFDYSFEWLFSSFLSILDTGDGSTDITTGLEWLHFENGGTPQIVNLLANNAAFTRDDLVSLTEDDGSIVGASSVLANDFDFEGDQLTVTAGSLDGSYGTLTLNSDGTYSYVLNAAAQTLAAGEEATDLFTYTVSDGALQSTGEIQVTITGLNDAPSALDDFVSDTMISVTGDVQVNSFATGNQGFARITQFADGGYLVVWISDGPLDGSDVYGQRYDASGAAVGGEFLINSYTAGLQGEAQVATLSNGGFVVTWMSWFQDLDPTGGVQYDPSYGVFARVFDANGNPVGPEFHVNTYAADSQAFPEVTALADGNFVVTWESEGQDGSNTGIYARVYDQNGSALTGELPVNSETIGQQARPEVTALPDGGFMVVWASNPDSSGGYVQGRRFDSDWNSVGGEFQINQNSAGHHWHAGVTTLSDGTLVAIWEARGEIFARQFAADGTPLGDETRVNTFTVGAQWLPSVTAMPDGGFLVSWSSDIADGDSYGVFAQRFDSAGATVGAEFQVNTFTAGNQWNPDLTVTASGNAVFVWHSSDADQDGSGAGVFMRSFSTALATGEDSSITIDVLANDSDVDASDVLTITDAVLLDGAAGQLSVAPDGQTLTFDPSAQYDHLAVGESSLVAIRYTISDGNGGTDSASASVVVTGVNDAPIAVDDVAATDEDTVLNVAADGILANDSDVDASDGRSVSAVEGLSANVGTQVTLASGALLTMMADGSYSYDPNGQFEHLAVGESATDTFTYEVSDGNGGTDTATVTVTIDGVNDAPQVSSNFLGIGLTEGTGVASLNMLTNAFDVDNGAVLSVQNVTDLTQGITWSGTQLFFDTNDPAFDYLGHNEIVSFTVNYEIVDEHGASIPRSYFFNLLGQNDAPVAVDDTLNGAAPVIGGAEFRVNTYTDNSQTQPAVAGLSDGGYIAIWQSYHQDGSEDGIFGQRFDAEGSPMGAEFQINAYTDLWQKEPSVTALADGGFLVTWTSYQQDGNNYGIFAKRYDSGGNAVGAEFQVNSYYLGPQTLSTAAGLPGGGFVVAWTSQGQDGSGQGIYGQRYDSVGNPVGTEFLVNSYTADDQIQQAIAALADGGFVVTWHSMGQDGSGLGIYGQRFDASGTAVGGEFQVNSFTSGDQAASSVAGLSDGGFIVSWFSAGQDGSGGGIFAQRFDPTGAPVGPEFQVNSHSADWQVHPSVTALEDGGCIITWSSGGQDGNGSGIFGQRYDSAGTAVGGEFQVNSLTVGNQVAPSVAGLAGGGFAVAWESIASGAEIQGRVFSAPPVVLEDSVFVIATADLLGNDSDVDGDTLSVSAVSAASSLGAALTVNADGTVAYDPTASAALQALGEGETATDSFTYDVSDGNGGTDAASVTVTVTGTNDAPTVGLEQSAPGDFDLLIATDETPDLLFENDGQGQFTALSNGLGIGGDNIRVAAADLDGDGDNDLVIGGHQSGGSPIWLNDGNGNFHQGQDLGSLLVGSLEVGDFDGDNDIDIIKVGTSRTATTLFVNDGTGNFSARNIGNDYSYGSSAVDVDNDGDLDLIVAGYYEPSKIYFNDGSGTFAVDSTTLPTSTYTSVVTGDFDSDGDVDIAMSDLFGKRIDIFLSDGSGQYTTTSLDLADYPYALEIADLDGDGSLDIIVGTGGSEAILFGDGHGSFVNSNQSLGTTLTKGLAIGDVDGDGDIDFVAANDGADSRLYLNDGAGFFSDSGQSLGIASSFAAILVDLDGDAPTASGGITEDPPLYSGAPTDDDDGDGVPNESDNAPNDPNMDQVDTDGDGVGDVADLDPNDPSVGLPDPHSTSGEISFSDPDGSDSHQVRTEFSSSTHSVQLGTLVASITAPASGGSAGTIRWDFSVDAAAIQFLGAGETITELHTVLVEDDHGAFATQDLTITITGTNDAPVVTAIDSGAVGEDDAPVLIDLLAGQSDPDGDALAATGIAVTDDLGNPVAFTDNGDGTISIDPGQYNALNDGESRTLTVDYDVSDGLTSTANSASLVVNGATDNLAPVAVDDTGWETPPPIGSEFRVNSQTASEQRSPTVAALEDGGFVAVWMSYGQDGSSWGIFGQRYDAGGNPVGSEFQVNSYALSDQATPALAALPNGGFVVTWDSNNQDSTGDTGVYGQIFASDGTRVGGEFRANSTIAGTQAGSSITSLADGNFVVAWTSYGQDGSGAGIFAQRYDASGAQIGTEFQINSYTTHDQMLPELAAVADGGFIATWRSFAQDGSGWGIYGQRYDAAGNQTGTEFRVNSSTLNNQIEQVVTGIADGGFVVVWSSSVGDGSSWGILGQRFDASGNAVGPEFLVNSTTANVQEQPSIAALPDGGFIVTWQSDASGNYETLGQRFDASGNRVGSEFQINSETLHQQWFSSVAALSDGRLIVAWESNLQDGSGHGIYAQIFAAQFATSEDDPFVIPAASLLANDSDPDGDPLSISAVAASSSMGAAVTLNPDGTVTYDPSGSATLDALNDGESTTDTFTYTVSDGNGGTDTGTVSVVVFGVDDAASSTTTSASSLSVMEEPESATPSTAFDRTLLLDYWRDFQVDPRDTFLQAEYIL